MLNIIIENEKGEQLLLTDEAKFSVHQVTGLGPPTATLSFTDNTDDGSQFQHQRVAMRNVVINMEINGDPEINRLELYDYVQVGGKIKIYVETYRRDVWIEGYVETCEVDPFAKKTTCQISILCGDPWWKDLQETIEETSIKKGTFYFPYWTVEPKPVGFYERIEVLDLINKGNTSSGMTIEMVATKGVVVNPIIYNRETKEYIGLGTEDNPFEIYADLDKVVITTHPLNKKVTLIRYGDKLNRFNYLQEGSTFFEVKPGSNVFTFSADEGKENLNITFKYNSQYKGI